MKMLKLLVCVGVLFAAGCAGGGIRMPLSANQQIQDPPDGQAQVVFMRSTFVGSAFSASLWDTTAGEPQFLGVIQNANKIVHTVDPGKHMFMVVGESADYMGADVEAGETYYAMVVPRMGVWTPRFSIIPIRRTDSGDEFNMQSDDFDRWTAKTRIVELNDQARAWATQNKTSIQSKHDAYWPKWQAKPETDKQKRSLQPDDGV